MKTRLVALLALAAVVVAACASAIRFGPTGGAPARFRNAYVVPEDTGERVPPTYFLHRAWVQITRDLDRTEVPPTVPLALEAMAQERFAVSWLGHATLLVRAGAQWVLIDPVFSPTAGPVPPFGPARLAPLPIAPTALPHIDLVLISHDHFDHLDAASVRQLARQPGGPPRFLAGLGLADWFAEKVGVRAEALDWWETRDAADLRVRFVPAQHSSGRQPWHRNDTLWGGWVLEHAGRRFYFPGDTAYVPALFRDVRARAGAADLAALPIGAYQPRAFMRHEHLDPDDAVQAHGDVGAAQSFGVHWGTFQLGDEEPFQPARDLDAALRARGAVGVGLLPIGATFVIAPREGTPVAAVPPPSAMVPRRAGVRQVSAAAP